MPYIRQSNRDNIDKLAHDLLQSNLTFGELNYTITILLKKYLETSGTNYLNINGIIGVLECAKQELYRKVATPYEELKIQQNGDIF